VPLPLEVAVTEALTLVEADPDSLGVMLADPVALPLEEEVASTEDVTLALAVCTCGGGEGRGQ
jgi:hypothetical protein